MIKYDFLAFLDDISDISLAVVECDQESSFAQNLYDAMQRSQELRYPTSNINLKPYKGSMGQTFISS